MPADLVERYMRLERELLSHRLANDLADVPYDEADPVEVRIEREFESIWDRMTDDERRRLRHVREQRAHPWAGVRVEEPRRGALVDGPSPRVAGLPVRRVVRRSAACT